MYTDKQQLENRVMHLEQLLTNFVQQQPSTAGTPSASASAVSAHHQHQPQQYLSGGNNGGARYIPSGSATANTHQRYQQHYDASAAVGGGVSPVFARPPPSSSSSGFVGGGYNDAHHNQHHHSSAVMGGGAASSSSATMPSYRSTTANNNSGMHTPMQHDAASRYQQKQQQSSSAAHHQQQQQQLQLQLSTAYRRIADLELSHSKVVDQLKTKDERIALLTTENETLRHDLDTTQSRLTAAVANSKLAEAAANVATVEARKAVEEAERSADVWGTIQQLRAAFGRAELQNEMRRNGTLPKQQHLGMMMQPTAAAALTTATTVKKEPETATATKSIRGSGGGDASVGGASISDFVSSYSHGVAQRNNAQQQQQQQQHNTAATSKVSAIANTLDAVDAELVGQKRRRAEAAAAIAAAAAAAGNTTTTVGGYNSRLETIVVASTFEPPRGAVSLTRPLSGHDDVRYRQYYDDGDDTTTTTNTTGGSDLAAYTPNTKSTAAARKKAGRTPRTPIVTGADKVAMAEGGAKKTNYTAAADASNNNYNHNSRYTTAQSSISSQYKGPVGVRQMSGASYTSMGGGNGITPPFSPAPKPVKSAAGVMGANNTNIKVIGGGGGGTAAPPTYAQDDDEASAVFDTVTKPIGVGVGGVSTLSVSAAPSSLHRSHTNMSLRKGARFGFGRGGGGADGGGITRSPTPTNPTRGPDTERRFILSGITDDERREIHNAIQRLGQKASIIDSGVDAAPPASCTHIVIPGMPQSFKALCGLVSCRWLITPEYIYESLAAGFWLNENDSNHVRCHPAPLAGQQFMVVLPPTPNGGSGRPTPEMQAMKARLEYVIQYGDGIVVKEAAAGSGVVIIQSGDDIFNYCLRPTQ